MGYPPCFPRYFPRHPRVLHTSRAHDASANLTRCPAHVPPRAFCGGGEHRSGWLPLVRPADGRHGEVLGLERTRPARGRNHHRPHHPRGGFGHHDCDEHLSGGLPLVCLADGRHDEVLGLQQPRPARGRNHHPTHHPRGGVIHHDGDEHRSEVRFEEAASIERLESLSLSMLALVFMKRKREIHKKAIAAQIPAKSTRKRFT